MKNTAQEVPVKQLKSLTPSQTETTFHFQNYNSFSLQHQILKECFIFNKISGCKNVQIVGGVNVDLKYIYLKILCKIYERSEVLM